MTLEPTPERCAYQRAIVRGEKGVHYCPDWDYMAIWQGTPEWDACTCDKGPLLETKAGGTIKSQE